MKALKLFILFFVLVASLISCTRSDYIRNDSVGFIGFRFFLFAQFGQKKVQANGDAVLVKGDRFSFRLFDNLMNQYVMCYSSEFNGQQSLILPMNKVVYKKYDAELSEILINKLYSIIKGELINSEKDDTINKVELENNEIKSIIFHYGEWELSLEVLKRMEDGRPSRIKIINGENSLIFDIVEYHPYSFNVELDGYKYYTIHSNQAFLSWIGEVYAGK